MFDGSFRLCCWYDLFAVCRSSFIIETDRVGDVRQECRVGIRTDGNLVCCEFSNHRVALHEAIKTISDAVRLVDSCCYVLTDRAFTLALIA